MKEKSLQVSVGRWLDSQPDVWAVKYHGGPFGKRGVPDFLGHCHGIFFGIELKTPTGKLSALQIYAICQIQKAGGQAVVARSLDEVKAFVIQLRGLYSEHQEVYAQHPLTRGGT
jgi:hypothetical protein